MEHDDWLLTVLQSTLRAAIKDLESGMSIAAHLDLAVLPERLSALIVTLEQLADHAPLGD